MVELTHEYGYGYFIIIQQLKIEFKRARSSNI